MFLWSSGWRKWYLIKQEYLCFSCSFIYEQYYYFSHRNPSMCSTTSVVFEISYLSLLVSLCYLWSCMRKKYCKHHSSNLLISSLDFVFFSFWLVLESISDFDYIFGQFLSYIPSFILREIIILMLLNVDDKYIIKGYNILFIQYTSTLGASVFCPL